MLKEKRSHYRLRVDLPIVYTISNQQVTTTKKSTTHDLSDTGMGFYTDTSFKKGIKLKVYLSYLFDTPKTCTVKWSSRKNANFYRVGVHF